ncbi:MAG: hypothetical protein JW900_09940 [Anaerolineae bacterium]|nr:hypothetical protein [Anaerolineae bacterium]
MKRKTLLIGILFLLGSLSCQLTIPSLPDVEIPDIELPDIELPRLEVGEMQEYDEMIPADGVTEAQVRIRFGVGEIALAANDEESFFAGQFRTNVAEWAPEVDWEDGELWIEQGGGQGIPDPGADNQWHLEFSPDVSLDMDIDIGAGEGDLDFTGLSVESLALDIGASDLMIHFDEPVSVGMERLEIRSGAASIRLDGVGNASPEQVRIEGGVGNMILDLGGDWANSSDMTVVVGAGSFTIYLPREIGVRVEVEGGLGNVELGEGLSLSEGGYVNEAYGDTEIELLIELTVGVGNVELELAGE